MWTVVAAPRILRRIRRFPLRDHDRILATLIRMESDPFALDIRKLAGSSYRVRVGDYRIFVALDFERREAVVSDVVRRTSTTY